MIIITVGQIEAAAQDLVRRIRGENPLETLPSQASEIFYGDLKRICESAGFPPNEEAWHRTAYVEGNAVRYCSSEEQAVKIVSDFYRRLLEMEGK